MNVLTDDECRDIYNTAMEAPVRSAVSVTRAIEQAVIRKLAEGVSVEPCIYEGDASPLYEAPTGYTLGQLTTAIAAARVQENERCLAMMDAIGCDWRDAGDMAKFYATNYLREAIRALLGKEAKS